VLHAQTAHLAEVRTLLAKLYQRDGVQVDDALLNAQAEGVVAKERGERFLAELATRIHPSEELLELAGQLDAHALGVWREAAASPVEVCPPSLLHLRWRVEEEQRGELRSHAHLVRAEATLGARLRCFGLLGRWRHRRQVAELRGQVAGCRGLRERAERRLAHLDAKLQVIDRAEQARWAWITESREVLMRGLTAIQVLTERKQPQEGGGPPRPAAVDGRMPLRVVS
jgi:hypothetical protein